MTAGNEQVRVLFGRIIRRRKDGKYRARKSWVAKEGGAMVFRNGLPRVRCEVDIYEVYLTLSKQYTDW